MMKILHWIAAFSLVCLTTAAQAQQAKTEGLPVKLGDTVSQLQAVFQTPIEPEAYEGAVNKGGTVLRLRTKGVWTFFNKDGQAITIRLDAPFKGSVGGVKIGDSLRTLKKLLGEPVKKPFKFGMNEAHLYYPDDTYTARFDVNDAGEVETIFITK